MLKILIILNLYLQFVSLKIASIKILQKGCGRKRIQLKTCNIVPTFEVSFFHRHDAYVLFCFWAKNLLFHDLHFCILNNIYLCSYTEEKGLMAEFLKTEIKIIVTVRYTLSYPVYNSVTGKGYYCS